MSSAQFEKDQRTHLPIVPMVEDCKSGTYIVTGANTGLGYECAKHLVQLSADKVILAVRSLSKGEAARDRIEADTGIKGVAEVWQLDMGSYDPVIAFSKKVEGLDRVDAIVENAGIALDQWSDSDGLETTLTVNVTGTLLLAVLVLPKLQESAVKFGILPHCSIIGSAVAFLANGELEKVNGDILDGLNNKSLGMGNRYARAKSCFCKTCAERNQRYPISKLVSLYASRELAFLKPVSQTGVVINWVNPGLCITELDRHVNSETREMINDRRRKFGRTAEEGSRTLLQGAVAGKESHGKYLSECVVKE